MVQALGIAAFCLLLCALGLLSRLLYLRFRRKQMEEQLKEAREAANEFKEMMETAGWQRLKKIMDTQIEGRQNEILLQPVQDTHAQEYSKGELHGIRLTMDIPRLAIELSKDLTEQARKLEEDENA